MTRHSDASCGRKGSLLVGLFLGLQLPFMSSEPPQHFPTQLAILRGAVEESGRCAGGREFARGGFDAGQACTRVGAVTAGSCGGGTWISRTGSCTNPGGTAYCTCGDDGVPECVNGIGEAGVAACYCDAPNTDGRCMGNTDCTGGGTCSGYGECAATNSGSKCLSTLECTGAGGEVRVGDGTQTEQWPGASQVCKVPPSPGNQSAGVVYGGEAFGPLVVAMKDAAFRTLSAGEGEMLYRACHHERCGYICP